MSSLRTRELGAGVSVAEYAFYGLVLAFVFDALPLGGGASVTKWAGVLFTILSVFEVETFYRRIPRAFLFFAGYVAIGTLVDLARAPLGLGALNAILTPTLMGILILASYNLAVARGPMRLIFVLGASSMLYATIQVLGLGEAWTHVETEVIRGQSFDRIAALAANENYAAMFCSLGIIMGVVVAFGLFRARWPYRLAASIGAVMGMVAIVMTSSRGGLVALAIGLLAIATTTRGRSSRAKALVVATLVLTASGYYVWRSDLFRYRLEQSIQTGDTAGREVIWSEALKVSLERPIFGHGAQTYARDVGAAMGYGRMVTHNVFLSVLLGSGLTGAALFLWFYLRAARAAWSSRQEEAGSLVLPMFMVGLVGGLSANLEAVKWFWLVTALALATDQWYAAQHAVSAEARRDLAEHSVPRSGVARHVIALPARPR